MDDIKIKGYMCQTDWDTDLPLGANDVKIYTDLDVLKRQRKCVKECGIVEVEVTLVKVVEPGNASWR